MSSLSTALISFIAIVGPLTWLALRDHKALRASRAGLLDDCARLFNGYALTHSGDSFPKLSGRCDRRNVDIRLISDTMTIRRLPQLWLQVTVLEKVQGSTGLAVLVRPSGYEFYSLTPQFPYILETPPEFPPEVIIRGENARAEKLLEKLAKPMAAILADPRVKEIAVTREGLRIIRQAGEGRRGEYLLLRQAVFDEAAVSADQFQSVLAEIDTLRTAIENPQREHTYA
ncbi:MULTISPECIES: hypothetical protein [Hyphomicrobium]|uniref:hypothetical protein n=1 Tax=Hyphomicrobium TaxID=81 RepID=UPI00036B08C4|nr:MULTISPECIES: hypothetical protein [Hyphomicrobium]WBT36445.1 hypothetical protein PE058_12340 [Hyphomicrobium sp. DMF-1]HML42165.1 hypothetical protein [Hyphomicrobium zavarzinii]